MVQKPEEPPQEDVCGLVRGRFLFFSTCLRFSREQERIISASKMRRSSANSFESLREEYSVGSGTAARGLMATFWGSHPQHALTGCRATGGAPGPAAPSKDEPAGDGAPCCVAGACIVTADCVSAVPPLKRGWLRRTATAARQLLAGRSWAPTFLPRGRAGRPRTLVLVG